MSMQQDDALTFSQNSADAPYEDIGDENDDPNGPNPPEPHHQFHRVSEKPGMFTLPGSRPGPRRSPFVIDAPVHRVNGRQLSNPTRTRDRDMLES